MNTARGDRLRRVMIVDGDRDFAGNLRDILASEGYEAALAHGAAAAEVALGELRAALSGDPGR